MSFAGYGLAGVCAVCLHACLRLLLIPAEVYRRLGRSDKADAILKRIVDKSAADHNIIPETYVVVPCRLFPGAIGDPTGAFFRIGSICSIASQRPTISSQFMIF